MKRQKKIVCVAMLTVVMIFCLTGCSLKKLTAVEKAQNIITAYQAGDAETFMGFFTDDNRMEFMMNGLDDENAEGMVEVYQKVHELTKVAEFVFAEDNSDDEYATVTVKTVDYSGALYEAMLEAAEEGEEAFSDVPTWMLKALNEGGEEVEVEVQVRTDSRGDIDVSHSEEFLQALTGGFYDYVAFARTACTTEEGEESIYMLASYDVVKFSLDNYFFSDEGMELTDEDVNEVIAEFVADYEDLDGIVAGGSRVDGGIRMYMVIDYDLVSDYTLQRLGLASGGYIDYISLSASVNGFEDDGYTCEKTDFGSGAMSNKSDDVDSTEE